MRRAYDPRPVPAMLPYQLEGKIATDDWRIDPNCPWCRWPDGVFYYRRHVYGWHWRHTGHAGLTVLETPPMTIEVPFARYRRYINAFQRRIDHYLPTVEGIGSPDAATAVTRGYKVAPAEAAETVRALRSQHWCLRAELYDYSLAMSMTPPHLEDEEKGIWATLVALEDAAWFPHLLTERRCVRVPYTPNWRNGGRRQRGKWAITGHYSLSSTYYEDWHPYLEPLGITFI